MSRRPPSASLCVGSKKILGVELFHRFQAGVARLVLTDHARASIPDLQAGFDRLAMTFEHLRAGRARITISVTVPPAFADKWLLPRVEQFAAQHPDYDLRIDRSGRLVDFAADRIDVGIRYGVAASASQLLPTTKYKRSCRKRFLSIRTSRPRDTSPVG
jgi:LysR family transcriptional regulator, glycine cleavage system transcriptional activator